MRLPLGLLLMASLAFDLVLAADVLEHVPEPESLLRGAAALLKPNGVMIACVPNISHWYQRSRVAAGRFAYERRGILDRGHLRFFTRRTFKAMADECGFDIARSAAVGVPFEVLERGGRGSQRNAILKGAQRVDKLATSAWPTMFGYQLLFELTKQTA